VGAIAAERRLHSRLHVNRLSEHSVEGGTLMLADPERRALEMRIERAKSRIVADLNRASGLVHDVASRARHRLGMLAVVSAVFVTVILVAALFLRNRRRVRILWP
jgi:hypothetical protein